VDSTSKIKQIAKKQEAAENTKYKDSRKEED
jgi:hypothetical protein